MSFFLHGVKLAELSNNYIVLNNATFYWGKYTLTPHVYFQGVMTPNPHDLRHCLNINSLNQFNQLNSKWQFSSVTINTQRYETLWKARSDLPGGWGFNPPNDFLTPRVSVDLSSWGSILTPVLVLHVSACGASALSPVGDPQMFFFYKSDTGEKWTL